MAQLAPEFETILFQVTSGIGTIASSNMKIPHSNLEYSLTNNDQVSKLTSNTSLFSNVSKINSNLLIGGEQIKRWRSKLPDTTVAVIEANNCLKVSETIESSNANWSKVSKVVVCVGSEWLPKITSDKTFKKCTEGILGAIQKKSNATTYFATIPITELSSNKVPLWNGFVTKNFAKSLVDLEFEAKKVTNPISKKGGYLLHERAIIEVIANALAPIGIVKSCKRKVQQLVNQVEDIAIADFPPAKKPTKALLPPDKNLHTKKNGRTNSKK